MGDSEEQKIIILQIFFINTRGHDINLNRINNNNHSNEQFNKQLN